MRAVMRAQEKHWEGGWILNLRSRTRISTLTPEPGGRRALLTMRQTAVTAVYETHVRQTG